MVGCAVEAGFLWAGLGRGALPAADLSGLRPLLPLGLLALGPPGYLVGVAQPHPPDLVAAAGPDWVLLRSQRHLHSTGRQHGPCLYLLKAYLAPSSAQGHLRALNSIKSYTG